MSKVVETGSAATLGKVSTGVSLGANLGQAVTFHAAKKAALKAGTTFSGSAMATTLGGVGTVAGMGVDYWNSEEGKQALAKQLDVPVNELEGRLAKDSAILRDVVDNSENLKLHIVPKAGVVTAGSMLGNLIPIPFVGMLAGGVAANYLYDLALVGASDEVAQMVGQISTLHQHEDEQGKSRTPISGIQVFAITAANSHKALRNLIKKDLLKEAGTELFSEALSTEKGQAALVKLAKKYDAPISTSKPGFEAVEGVTASEQIADAINNGEMRVADLLMNERFLAAAMKHNDKLFMEAYQIDPVALSGMQMASGGVVHDGGDRLPSGSAHRHMKKGQTVPTLG